LPTLLFAEFLTARFYVKKIRTRQLLSYGIYTSHIKGNNVKYLILSFVLAVGLSLGLISNSVSNNSTFVVLNNGEVCPTNNFTTNWPTRYNGTILYPWYAETNPTNPFASSWTDDWIYSGQVLVSVLLPFVAIIPKLWNLITGQYADYHMGAIVKRKTLHLLSHITYKVKDNVVGEIFERYARNIYPKSRWNQLITATAGRVDEKIIRMLQEEKGALKGIHEPWN